MPLHSSLKEWINDDRQEILMVSPVPVIPIQQRPYSCKHAPKRRPFSGQQRRRPFANSNNLSTNRTSPRRPRTSSSKRCSGFNHMHRRHRLNLIATSEEKQQEHQHKQSQRHQVLFHQKSPTQPTHQKPKVDSLQQQQTRRESARNIDLKTQTVHKLTVQAALLASKHSIALPPPSHKVAHDFSTRREHHTPRMIGQQTIRPLSSSQRRKDDEGTSIPSPQVEMSKYLLQQYLGGNSLSMAQTKDLFQFVLMNWKIPHTPLTDHTVSDGEHAQTITNHIRKMDPEQAEQFHTDKNETQDENVPTTDSARAFKNIDEHLKRSEMFQILHRKQGEQNEEKENGDTNIPDRLSVALAFEMLNHVSSILDESLCNIIHVVQQLLLNAVYVNTPEFNKHKQSKRNPHCSDTLEPNSRGGVAQLFDVDPYWERPVLEDPNLKEEGEDVDNESHEQNKGRSPLSGSENSLSSNVKNQAPVRRTSSSSARRQLSAATVLTDLQEMDTDERATAVNNVVMKYSSDLTTASLVHVLQYNLCQHSPCKCTASSRPTTDTDTSANATSNTSEHVIECHTASAINFLSSQEYDRLVNHFIINQRTSQSQAWLCSLLESHYGLHELLIGRALETTRHLNKTFSHSERQDVLLRWLSDQPQLLAELAERSSAARYHAIQALQSLAVEGQLEQRSKDHALLVTFFKCLCEECLSPVSTALYESPAAMRAVLESNAFTDHFAEDLARQSPTLVRKFVSAGREFMPWVLAQDPEMFAGMVQQNPLFLHTFCQRYTSKLVDLMRYDIKLFVGILRHDPELLQSAALTDPCAVTESLMNKTQILHQALDATCENVVTSVLGEHKFGLAKREGVLASLGLWSRCLHASKAQHKAVQTDVQRARLPLGSATPKTLIEIAGKRRLASSKVQQSAPPTIAELHETIGDVYALKSRTDLVDDKAGNPRDSIAETLSIHFVNKSPGSAILSKKALVRFVHGLNVQSQYSRRVDCFALLGGTTDGVHFDTEVEDLFLTILRYHVQDMSKLTEVFRRDHIMVHMSELLKSVQHGLLQVWHTDQLLASVAKCLSALPQLPKHAWITHFAGSHESQTSRQRCRSRYDVAPVADGALSSDDEDDGVDDAGSDAKSTEQWVPLFLEPHSKESFSILAVSSWRKIIGKSIGQGATSLNFHAAAKAINSKKDKTTTMKDAGTNPVEEDGWVDLEVGMDLVIRAWIAAQEQSTRELEILFQEADTNGDGILDLDEWAALVGIVDPSMDEHTVIRMFKLIGEETESGERAVVARQFVEIMRDFRNK